MCFMKFDKRLFEYNISPRAMILYAMFSDRMKLSEQNESFKDNDGVFIYFTIEEIKEVFKVGKDTARILIKELEQAKLIRKKRQGLCKPNKIYINNISSAVLSADSSAVLSADSLAPNKTNINKTNISSSSIREENKTERTERIKTQINYDELRAEHKGNERTLDLIVRLLASSPNSYSGIDKQIVSEVMNNIKNADLKKVRNFKAYLKAFIDNAYYKPSNTKLTSYEPTYSITEYESTSITDFITDDYFKPKV